MAAQRANTALSQDFDRYKMPELKTPPPPHPTPTNPVEIWGSAAMVVAGLGSLLVRRHATSALNAASAVMNAYAAKDKNQADLAFKTWQAETQNATAMVNFQNQSYKMLFDQLTQKQRENLEVGKAIDTATAARLRANIAGNVAAQKDAPMQLALAQGLPAAAALQTQREEKARKLEEATNPILAAKKETDITAAAMADPAFKGLATDRERLEYLAGKGSVTASKKLINTYSGAGAGANRRVDPNSPEGRKQVEEIAVNIIKSGGSLPPNTNANVALRNAVLTYIRTNVDPEFDGTRLISRDSMVRSLANGPMGKALTSYDTVAQHVEAMEKLLKNQTSGTIRWQDGIGAAYERWAGKAAPASQDTTAELLADEIIKATTGSSGGVEERIALKQRFMQGTPRDQVQAALDAAKDLVRGNFQARRQIVTAAGVPESTFLRYLTPNAKNMLENAGAAMAKEEDKPANWQEGDVKAPRDGKWYRKGPDGKYHPVPGN